VRVRIVGRGTLKGLERGSDIDLMIVPLDADDRIDRIPVSVRIDPESDHADPELIFEVPDA